MYERGREKEFVCMSQGGRESVYVRRREGGR